MVRLASPIALSILCTAALGQPAPVLNPDWEIFLQPRYINGDFTVPRAYYDGTTYITWLRQPSTERFESWQAAVDYAAKFELGGVTDWRLPNVTAAWGGPMPELSRLWNQYLGNAPGLPRTADPFVDVVFDNYWYGEEAYDPGQVYAFSLKDLSDITAPKTVPGGSFGAWLVRGGDIFSPVPEPPIWALILGGFALGLGSRRATANTGRSQR